MMDAKPDFWKKCNSCKKSVGFRVKYYVCSVSTCTRKRTGLVFCSVSCWDAHVPGMNHRESWAEERTSPSLEAYLRDSDCDYVPPARKDPNEGEPTFDDRAYVPPKKIQTPPSKSMVIRRTQTGEQVVRIQDASPYTSTSSATSTSSGAAFTQSESIAHTDSALEKEILVVVSKVKDYIRRKSDMSTSDSVMQLLSSRIRRYATDAAALAKQEGRMTVLERDAERVVKKS